MGIKKSKYESVNMSTEETKTPSPTPINNTGTSINNTSKSSNNTNVNNNTNINSGLNSTGNRIKVSTSNDAPSGHKIKEDSVRHISFNQKDINPKQMPNSNVRRVEDPRNLFKEEKERPADMKLVIIPALVLLAFCILNEIFVVPIVIEKVCKYVLHGEVFKFSIASRINNDQLLVIAGLTAIVGYCIFSLTLLAFSIYNFFKLTYIQRDINERVLKILLYTFLIGFVIAGVDCFTKYNISNTVVKITSFNMRSMNVYLKK